MTVKITVINNKNQYLKQRDDEKCCVCKLFTPKEIRESPCLIFTKWMLFYPLYEVAKRRDCKIKLFHDPTVLLL
jgi:hypothetical protein